MDYKTATPDMVDAIHRVLHTAIQTVYPKYYPKEVVDCFCRHHSRAHIAEDIDSGNMGVLTVNGAVVGTGCFDNNHITGLYVLPEYQNQGFDRGYKTVGHGIYTLENDIRLVYEIMEKKLRKE